MRDLKDFINWRRLDDKITLSGQPTEKQLSEIKDLGVTHIINLGPHSNKGALPDEAASVAALGMEYIYIPVKFQTPTDEDFAKFCEAIESNKDTKIHVHCIYNARVTAFLYRYAKSKSDMDDAKVYEIMDGIWRPGNDWAKFLNDDTAFGQLNKYAGEDY
ncbi:hypothetical protein F9L33_10620 [Amylibacter sp. SFDW26]|uniref:protein tyrosine phosphatase family protein n=1 Tax=Amylibacter sp. SFDW26 TaxID=2652722 RepID=UPI0012617107|nr:protein tyrosine phosphatase family protein [Amylibacter sp. SFDW26]KAB7613812.1 hypothetical protein F9L33_10620 [Amylibacter sp. SFDW26]